MKQISKGSIISCGLDARCSTDALNGACPPYTLEFVKICSSKNKPTGTIPQRECNLRI